MVKKAKNKSIILSIILISYFVIVLDISVVITALPKIQESLHLSQSNLTWVQNTYTLIFGGLLLLGGRAGDIFGRRKMFILGLIIFGLGSLLVGTALNAVWLVIARALQGVGATLLAPSTLALLMDNFEEGEERTKAVSYYGAVAGIGASAGLVLGGIFASWLSWRYAFFINVPISIVMYILTKKHIKESATIAGKFDISGTATSLLGIVGLVYGIVTLEEQLMIALISIAVGGILLITFVYTQKRADQPIMPLRLFKSGERNGAYLARMLFLGAMMAFWFFITQFLQSIYGFSPLQAGIGFFPMTVANFISAMLVPRFTRSYNNGRVLLCGLIITTIGMFWLSFVSGNSSYIASVALPMIFIGFGQGLSLSPLTAAGIAHTEASDAGAASGVVNVAHQVGGSLGLALLVAISSLAASSGLVTQVNVALKGGSVMLVLAIILVVALILPVMKKELKN